MKNDEGHIPFDTNIPLVDEIGAEVKAINTTGISNKIDGDNKKATKDQKYCKG